MKLSKHGPSKSNKEPVKTSEQFIESESESDILDIGINTDEVCSPPKVERSLTSTSARLKSVIVKVDNTNAKSTLIARFKKDCKRYYELKKETTTHKSKPKTHTSRIQNKTKNNTQNTSKKEELIRKSRESQSQKSIKQNHTSKHTVSEKYHRNSKNRTSKHTVSEKYHQKSENHTHKHNHINNHTHNHKNPNNCTHNHSHKSKSNNYDSTTRESHTATATTSTGEFYNEACNPFEATHSISHIEVRTKLDDKPKRQALHALEHHSSEEQKCEREGEDWSRGYNNNKKETLSIEVVNDKWPNTQVERHNEIDSVHSRIITINNKHVPEGVHMAIAVKKDKYLSKNALKKIARKLAAQI